MEKRFIIIRCEVLSDQFECDADRTIIPKLFTLDEVKKYTAEKFYYIEDFDGEFSTKQEAINAFTEMFKEDRKWWRAQGIKKVKDALESCGGVRTRILYLAEVYEIMDDGTLKEREDLTTYEG